MKLGRKPLFAWSAKLAGLSAAAILVAFLAARPQPTEVAAANGSPEDLVKDVLDRVPSDAGFFAHGRAGDLLKTTLFKEIRKAIGAEGEKALKEVQDNVGILAEDVETVTFYYPQMPQGPGDEKTFVVAVVTNKPYSRSKLLNTYRQKDSKDSKEDADTVKLEQDFVLHFTNSQTFAVMHKSLVEKYKKGPISDRKEGPASKALKLATEKHIAVATVNFSALPNEILTALETQPQTRPFAPLFKATAVTFSGDLDTSINVEARFACENAKAANDAELSMKLLMKLAEQGLDSVLNDKKVVAEIGPLLPAVKEVQTSVKNIKIATNDKEMTASFKIKADMSIGEMVKSTLDKVKGDAAKAQGQNNLKQIALAMHSYHDANNGFPPAAICDKKGKPLLSWRVAILPYIEQAALYNQFKLDEPWDSENNIKLAKTLIKVYMIPGVTKDGETNYRVFTGGGAVFDMVQQSKIQEIADGTSNTLMIFESAERVPWTKPDEVAFDAEKDVKKLFLWKNDRTNIAMCDGSVRSISNKVSEKTLKNVIMKNDGNVIGEDFE
jgi:prepilin-type processing-associated H-X9-DG protein